MRGWVYIISNKSLKDIIKIGFSTKDPILRASEFNGTGLPYDYDVLYDALVINPRDVEQRVHKKLSAYRENKEWFRIDVETAIEAIRLIADEIILENKHIKSSKEIHSLRHSMVECHYKNYGNCSGDLKSYKGTMYCFKHYDELKVKRFANVRKTSDN
jgi:hypothetical protein